MSKELTSLEKAQISREYEIESLKHTLLDEYKVKEDVAEQLAERVYNGICNALGEILSDIQKDVISIVLEDYNRNMEEITNAEI